MQNPFHAGSTFINYKGIFSTVLMAMCDSNYCFICANVGSQGCISAGDVFNSCSLAEKIDRNTLNLLIDEPLAVGRKCVSYVIVADNVFALKRNVMVPHLPREGQVYNSRQRIFNYRLSAARCKIENTFGILSFVFRIFRKPMLLQQDKVRVITECCVLLHNFLRKSRSSCTIYSTWHF